MTRRLLGARLGVDLRGLRWAGIAMLGAGAVVAHLPGEAGIPCLLRSTTGVPCPACGMTTSVKAALRLDLAAALSANPFGVVALIFAVVLVS
ncbi:MAG: DUF2752 domain-containing protein, partial [Acidimicrobiales bacterium]